MRPIFKSCKIVALLLYGRRLTYFLFMNIGEELAIKDEELYAKKIADRFKETLAKYYQSGTTKRMFHPKMHGLVRAEFVVEKNIPEHLKVGLFTESKTYSAWVRLSNAKRHPQADKKKDMRGMAIKLVGVPGKKLLQDEQDAVTQDFLLVTAETLQTRSVKDFQKSIYALTGGFFKLLWYAITHLRVIRLSMKQISRCGNLFEKKYFSMTPYKYGDNNAVKYAAFPQMKINTQVPKKGSDNYLRELLIQDLSNEDIYYDFLVQKQLDPNVNPIEDPTVPWDSSFIKVATIKILKQSFDSDAQRKYGENLSFNPWHCVEAHRPLGGVNRARKVVYETISKFRRERNDVTHLEEPTEIISFE